MSIGVAAFDLTETGLDLSVNRGLTGVVDLRPATQLTTVSDHAFYGNLNVEFFHMSPAITTIGSKAFHVTAADDESAIEWNGVDCIGATRGATQPFDFQCAYIYTAENDCDVNMNTDQCCGTATKIIIDPSVVDIKQYAFATCNTVTSVDFSQAENLERILGGAFWKMESLPYVDMSPATKLRSISSSAFLGTASLSGARLSAEITSIGNRAFLNSNITSPSDVDWNGLVCADVTAGADWVLYPVFNFACPTNAPTTEPTSSPTTNTDVYTYTSETTCVHGPEGVSVEGGCCGTASTIVIDSSVVTIANYAFEKCVATSVDFSNADNLQVVGGGAFFRMPNLASVDMSVAPSLTTIKWGAFRQSPLLTSVKLASTTTTIMGHAFNDGGIRWAKQIDFNGVDCAEATANGNADWALYPPFEFPCGTLVYTSESTCSWPTVTVDDQCCGMATKIVIDSSVTDVARYAFRDCDTVTEIDFSNATSLKHIHGGGFYHMHNIESVDLSTATQLETIGQGAFRSDPKLTSVILPASLTAVANRAFLDGGLDTEATVDFGGSDCLAITAANDDVYPDAQFAFEFPCATDAPTTSPTASPSASPTVDTTVYRYTSDTSCTYSDNGSSQCCGVATTIVIDSSVVDIKAYAFAECDSVTSIDFSEATNLERILGGAFWKADSLTSADMSPATNLRSISSSAFHKTPSLANVKLSAATTSIGNRAFLESNIASPSDVDWNGLVCADVTAGANWVLYPVFDWPCPGNGNGLELIIQTSPVMRCAAVSPTQPAVTEVSVLSLHVLCLFSSSPPLTITLLSLKTLAWCIFRPSASPTATRTISRATRAASVPRPSSPRMGANSSMTR